MSITRQTSLPLSDNQCRTLVDSPVEGVMIADETHKITYINPALARILGVAAADIVGHDSSEVVDDAAHTHERTWLRDDGTAHPVRMSSWPTFASSAQMKREHLAGIVDSGRHGTIDLLAPPDRPDESAQLISRVRVGGRIAHYETDRITKAGRRIDVAITLSPEGNNAQTGPGTWTLAQDEARR